jgi:nucleoside-diphosphate-sugar epimerase
MKNVIITGANGMIGGLILKNLIQRNDVGKITTIVRRPLAINHPKIVEVIHNDFLNYSAIEKHLQNQQYCFFCIGVYTGMVPAKEFHKVTIDYTREFATAIRRLNDQTTFCFLSGQGADPKEKSRLMFARDKGIAENILQRLNFYRTYIFRPGYIYPVTPRKEPNLMYKQMRVIYKIFSPLFPNMGVHSEKLADTMIEVAFAGENKVIYENSEIRLYNSK